MIFDYITEFAGYLNDRGYAVTQNKISRINNRICDKIPFSKIFLNLDIVKCRKKKFLIIFVKKECLEIKYRKY